MVAVFDIGNTNIHIGLYTNHILSTKLIFPTRKKLPLKKIQTIFKDHRPEGVGVASVVPQLTRQLVSICKRRRVKPMIVSYKLKCGLKYRYRKPATLGADRIAAVAGALARYDTDVIVIDSGTATTIDVATRDGDYLGGIICPGLHMLSECMHEKTAQLPLVTITGPQDLIGRSTVECIASGLFNGTMAMIKGLVRDIKKQCRGEFFCVATGGSGRIIAQNVEEVQAYDEDLCLHGILTIYEKNCRAKKEKRVPQ
jgi:type III pantothenate kinase